MIKNWRIGLFLTGLLFSVEAYNMQALFNVMMGLWGGGDVAAARADSIEVLEIRNPFADCYMSSASLDKIKTREGLAHQAQLLIFRFSQQEEFFKGNEFDVIQNHFRAIVRLAVPLGAIVLMDGIMNVFVFFIEGAETPTIVQDFLGKYVSEGISTEGLRLNIVLDRDRLLFHPVSQNLRVFGAKLADAANFITEYLAPAGIGMPQIFIRTSDEDGAYEGVAIEAFLGAAGEVLGA